MARTLEQHENNDGFVKAGEVIEIRQTSALTLHDRRVLNMLIRHAGLHIAGETTHIIPIRLLRSPNHKGGERVKDSVVRLMTTLVQVSTRDSAGAKATFRTQLLSTTTTSDDEDAPGGEVRYSFSPELRRIMEQSQYWGRIKPLVMFAFSSKYSLGLYEALCLRRNLDRNEQEIPLDKFRDMLGIPKDKLTEPFNLIRWAVRPAVEEINKLSDFDVKVEPTREGGKQRGDLLGFRVSWAVKQPDAWDLVVGELMRPRLGRKARLAGTIEQAVF